MANISIKLNLKSLKSVEMKMKNKAGNQVDCLVIPIAENNLFKGEKGVYLDITAMELKNPTNGSKDTHLLKQNLQKDVYANMSDEQKKAMPILGNAIYWGKSGTTQESSSDLLGSDGSDLPY